MLLITLKLCIESHHFCLMREVREYGMMEIMVSIPAGEEGQVKIKDAGHKLLDFGSFLSKVSDLFNYIKR